MLIEVAPGIDVERDVLGRSASARESPTTVGRWMRASMRRDHGLAGRLRRAGGRVMSGTIRLELGVVAHLTLANPPLNLVTRELLIELGGALAALEAAAPGDVRAVVVTGEGLRAFSAGSHVAEFESQRGLNGRQRHALESGMADRLARLPMPTIAAIEGNALGGGLELALCCDIRVASETSRLGLPEVSARRHTRRRTQRLPRVVGGGTGREPILTGRVLTADEAERIGLVTVVVATGQALAAADEIAEEIAARSGRGPRGQATHRPRDRRRRRHRPRRGA